MAEGGGGSLYIRHEELQATSFSGGSEITFDFYCELCKDDENIVEAEGFCVDCNEYLCGECYNSHRRIRPTRHHKVLDKDNMPRDSPLSTDRVNKDIYTKCTAHVGEPVKFYCQKHDVLGCSMCFVSGHRSCPDIEFIMEKSEGIFDSQEYTEFILTLQILDKKLRDMIAAAKANTEQANRSYSEILESVKEHKQEVIIVLETLEQNIIDEAKRLVSIRKKTIRSISRKCSTLADMTKTMLGDFQSLHSSRRVYQTYISMKECGEQVKKLQANIRSAEEALVGKIYRFEPNRILQDFMGSLDTFGNILSDTQPIPDAEQTKSKKPHLLNPVHVADINVSSNRNQVCCITGSAIVSSTRLIVTDHIDRKVKLIDTTTNKLLGDLNINQQPWDVTVINRNRVAVTLNKDKKILLLCVSDALTPEREIPVKGCCAGIAYSKNRLVVSLTNPSKLEIMDLFGNVVKDIEKDRDGNQLFVRPEFVCVSKDGEAIYVSDCYCQSVTRLSFDGEVKCVYTDSDLDWSKKMCVNQFGSVYVCGANSRNVHMLTADLTKLKIILTEADGLTSGVWSVAHCPEKNRLYIGMWNNKNVKVFQM